MTDLTTETTEGMRRDARVVRENIPRGYLVAHRTANAVDVLLDALAAEKTAREEAERVSKGAEDRWREDYLREKARADKAERDAEVYHSGMLAAGAETQRLRDEKDAAEARVDMAVTAHQNALFDYDDAVEQAKARADNAEARVAALEAGINALADDGSKLGTSGRLLIWPDDLRALTEKGGE